jgi:hypothetical protein
MNTSAANTSAGSLGRKPATGAGLTLALRPCPSPLVRALASADRLRARITSTAHLRTKRYGTAGSSTLGGDLDLKSHELRDSAQQYGAAANRYKREPDRVAHLGLVLESKARAFVRAERRLVEAELGARRVA